MCDMVFGASFLCFMSVFRCVRLVFWRGGAYKVRHSFQMKFVRMSLAERSVSDEIHPSVISGKKLLPVRKMLRTDELL